MFRFFLNGMGAQKNELKKVFAGFFPRCFMEKLNEMVYEYFSNKSFFKRHKYVMFPQGHQILNIFRPSAHTMRGVHVLLSYPYFNIEKMVCPKNGCGLGAINITYKLCQLMALSHLNKVVSICWKYGL